MSVAWALREAAAALAAVGRGVGPTQGWEGAAAEAYAVAARELRRRADQLADVLLDAAHRLDAAAPNELDRLLADTRPLAAALAAGGRLLAHDPDAFGGDGRVLVAVGDVAGADDVAVLVPGLGTDAGDVATLTRRAADLREATDAVEPGEEHAVVAWIGYDAPEGIEALSERRARDGGALLAADVATLRADRAADPAHLTVVGHSYGATTVAHAATSPAGLAADDVVLVGSPGAGDARTAADLGPGRTWVLRDSHDPVAALGLPGPLGLGEDPAHEDFGATRLRAESPCRGGPGWPLADHVSYFAPGGEGLGNLAHVVADRGDALTTAPPLRDPWWAPPLDPELGRTPAGRCGPDVR